MTPLEHLQIAMKDTENYYREREIFQAKFEFGIKPAKLAEWAGRQRGFR